MHAEADTIHMQAVNEHNAARLPLLLSTKLLPDMEAAEAHSLQAHAAASRGQELAAQISELTVCPTGFMTLKLRLIGIRDTCQGRLVRVAVQMLQWAGDMRAYAQQCVLVRTDAPLLLRTIAAVHSLKQSWPVCRGQDRACMCRHKANT